jgi:hypothetical protein
MLKRCYGNKDMENKIKKVRFSCTLEDDLVSMKSDRRSSTNLLRYEGGAGSGGGGLFINSSLSSSPLKMPNGSSPPHLASPLYPTGTGDGINHHNNTADDENNGTREESTTQSEDRHLKLLNSEASGQKQRPS